MSTPPTPNPSRPPGVRPKRRWRALVAAAVAVVIPGVLWLASKNLVAALPARAAAGLVGRCPGARLTGTVRLDRLAHLVAGPILVPAQRPGAPPLVTIERVTVHPRLLALLRGRLEAGSIWLDGVTIVAGSKGEALSELASACASEQTHATSRPEPDPGRTVTVAFSRAVVKLGWSDEEDLPRLEVGPFSGTASFGREGGDATAQVSFQLPGAAHGTVHVRYAAGRAELEAKVRGFSPGSLPEAVRARLPIEPGTGSLDLDVDAPRLTAGGVGKARIQATLQGIELRSDHLAPEPVGPLTARLTATAAWDLRAGSLALEEARLDLGDGGRLGAPLRLAFSARPEPYVHLEVGPGSFDWEEMLAGLPPSLAPPAEAPAVRGSVAGHLAISGPLHRPDAWHIDGDLDASGLEAAPPRPGALDLAHPFTWRGRLPDGGARKVIVGPLNPTFVPVDALPLHVVRAVLTSEDAGFYGHHGFDLGEIQDALARSSQRRLRGASTITQQIAKNLFLSVERTYARKIREALTTVALETCFSKRRLLEIYLNVAEWGPGVFGIGEAARHWFGKDARDLSPKEAAFLATVIPNPIRYEMYRRRGALTENWEGRVRDLLTKLRAADVISEEQLRDAWGAPLAFARGA